MSTATKRRRTQDERSASTKHKLLDATIDCLVEYGYAGTTTARVAQRAGLTRGAQTHHFSSKADLVTAAVRHLASKRANQAFERSSAILQSEDPISAGLDLIWEMHRGPVFTATVELWLAARTDPTLRKQISAVEPTITDTVASLIRTVITDDRLQPIILSYLYTVMDTVRGILLGSFAYGDESQLEARWRRVRGELRDMATLLLEANGIDLKQSSFLNNRANTDGAP